MVQELREQLQKEKACFHVYYSWLFSATIGFLFLWHSALVLVVLHGRSWSSFKLCCTNFNRWLVLVVLASSGTRLHFEGAQKANSSNVKHYNYEHVVNQKQHASKDSIR